MYIPYKYVPMKQHVSSDSHALRINMVHAIQYLLFVVKYPSSLHDRYVRQVQMKSTGSQFLNLNSLTNPSIYCTIQIFGFDYRLISFAPALNVFLYANTVHGKEWLLEEEDMCP